MVGGGGVDGDGQGLVATSSQVHLAEADEPLGWLTVTGDAGVDLHHLGPVSVPGVGHGDADRDGLGW